MPRFFFDIYSGEMACDENGAECSSPKEVELYTRQLLPSIVRDIAKSGNNNSDCKVFVRDQLGRVVYMGSLIYSGAWTNSYMS